MKSIEQRDDGTVLVALPRNMHKPIVGGCQCPFCTAHPHRVPSWDAVASHPDKPYTWIVHYPELVP